MDFSRVKAKQMESLGVEGKDFGEFGEGQLKSLADLLVKRQRNQGGSGPCKEMDMSRIKTSWDAVHNNFTDDYFNLRRSVDQDVCAFRPVISARC